MFALAKEKFPTPEPMMMHMSCSTLVKRVEQYKDLREKEKKDRKNNAIKNKAKKPKKSRKKR